MIELLLDLLLVLVVVLVIIVSIMSFEFRDELLLLLLFGLRICLFFNSLRLGCMIKNVKLLKKGWMVFFGEFFMFCVC